MVSAPTREGNQNMATKNDVTSTQAKVDQSAPAGQIVTRLPYHPQIKRDFDVDAQQWKALVEAVWPLAKSQSSVLMALSYCKARQLDPFKRVVHIVPVWSTEANGMVETVWPGIAELRTTAFRTGTYAGREPSDFGPDVTQTVGKTTITYPDWAQVTVYRMVHGQRVPFPGPRVYWRETYSSKRRDDPSPNSMWEKRPRGQLDKCAEAAALRAAFPEELGGEYSSDEMHGKVLEGSYDKKSDGWSADAIETRPTRALSAADHATDTDGAVDQDDDEATCMPYVDHVGEVSDPLDPQSWCDRFEEDWSSATIDQRALLLGNNEDAAQEWAVMCHEEPLALWKECSASLDQQRQDDAAEGSGDDAEEDADEDQASETTDVVDPDEATEATEDADAATQDATDGAEDAEAATGANQDDAATQDAATTEDDAPPEIVKMFIAKNLSADETKAVVEVVFATLRKIDTVARLKRWRQINEDSVANLPPKGRSSIGKAFEKRMLELSS
jgi:phage recombination protein Bet